MRRLALFLALVLALPAQAGGTATGLGATSREIVGADSSKHVKRTESRGAGDPVQRFVESNISETLYHELGHALIDQLDLPVFGPEEFAADFFAIVLINRLHDEETVVRMAYDIAAAYDAGAVKEARHAQDLAMWDVHGIDGQRYYNLACHMYGANPEERDDVANELGLPDERAETCEDEYALTARAWGQVLDRVAEGAPGQSLEIDWVLDENSHLARYVASEVERINAIMALPETITVSVIPCGEVNAFYDPGPREITICTEMGDYLARLAKGLRS
jgi:hypothetical protein